ncbi:MAG: glycosyltransferase family 4 protein [Pseudomonadota bacterium]
MTLQVVHFASGDSWAGAEVQLHELSCAMNRVSGVEATVVLLNEGILAERLREAGVGVTVIDEGRYHAGKILVRLTRLLRRSRPHVVHTHRQKENVIGGIAARLARVPCCLRTVHGAPEFSAVSLKQKLSRFMDLRSASLLQDAVVMVTEELALRLRGDYGSVRVEVIENGIRRPSIALRSTPLYARPGLVNVAFVGRLVPVKRVDVFAGIAKFCEDQGDRRFHFHVFGEGSGSALLEDQIRAEGTDDLVSRWGFVSDMPSALAEMDVLVMTSDHEGLPMVMLEAMALHVPVVAHRVGGMIETLDGGEAGILVDTQSVSAFHEALVKVSDTDVAKRLSAEAFKQFETRYTADACAKRTVDLYRDCVGSEPAG